MQDRCDLLVLAAFPPELAELQAALASPSAPPLEVATRTVGIGLAAAASGASQVLEQVSPRAVVLVGTCGAYRGRGLAVLDVAVARKVFLVDAGARSGAAAFPGPMVVERAAWAGLAEGLASAGGRLVDVATTLAITTDDALADHLGGAAPAEHLEAFAVAEACQARDIPFCAALGVANTVGSTGRGEWRMNHQAASAGAVALVLRWIREGSAGLPPPSD